MENTDFYSARKTGYGFSKRILGITPDLSRTQEYALRGAAFELTHPYAGLSFWFSQDDKGCIVVWGGCLWLDSLKMRGKLELFSYVVPTFVLNNDEWREAEAMFIIELQSGTPFAHQLYKFCYAKMP